MPIRAGIDIDSIEFLGEAESAFYKMRELNADFTAAVKRDEAAVQHWLMYLSMLVDITSSSAMALAAHNMPYAMLMMRRLTMEYIVKALYYERYPDRAHYDLTLGRLREAKKRLEDSSASAQDLDEVDREIAKAEAAFPEHLEKKRVTITKMMHEIIGVEVYTLLYRGPSVYIHADALGIGELMPTEGSTVTGSLEIEDDRVNANVVDIGGNLLEFCNVLARTFPNAKTPLIDSQLSRLWNWYGCLAMRHSHGRPPEVLEELRRQHGRGSETRGS